MRRFWITIRGVITSVIVFCSCFVDPAGALVVRDIDTCVTVCLIHYNRYGDIYALAECIGYCSRYRQRHPVVQYRSRGELTRSECRKEAGAMFPQEFRYRREFSRWCRIRLH
jgi:hypothetical protein